MSSFTPLVKFETTFENDTITMSLKRLKRKAMMKLTPYLIANEESVSTKGKISEMELMNVSADMLPEHVVNFKGLKDADGNEISLEAMCEEAFFIPLQAGIISELFEITKLREEDAKNSQGQQDTLPKEPVSPEELPSPHTRVRSGPESSLHVAIDKKTA